MDIIRTAHRDDFRTTSDQHVPDRDAISAPVRDPLDTLKTIQLPQSPPLNVMSPNFLRNPRPPPLPPRIHKRQLSASAVGKSLEPESPAPAMAEDVKELELAKLKNRVDDWRGLKIKKFGDLLLFQILVILKNEADTNYDKRHYHVYLFERILLCCKSKNTRKGFWSSKKPDMSSPEAQRLVLKGRIFMQNVTDVVSISGNGQPRMQLFFKGESKDRNLFACFDDEATSNTWMSHVRLQSQACRP